MKKALIGFVLATSLIGNGVLSTPVIHTKEGKAEISVWENAEAEPFEPLQEDSSDAAITEEGILPVIPEITEAPELTPEVESDEFQGEISEEMQTEEIPFEEIPEEDSVTNSEITDVLEGELDVEKETEKAGGGYEPGGCLLDGTPNYVWRGEGTPAQEISGSRSYTAYAADGNYMKRATRILNRNAEMSDSISSLTDGIHKTDTGELRAYKKGRYFKKGRFALDGKVYYADVSGYLQSGWIKIAENRIESLKTSDFVWKYCDPQTKIRFENGYKEIDGKGHYFIPEESGNLAFNKSYIIEGRYYYCDKYGICDTVKLKYGNTVTNETGSSLNKYLAVNQLPKDHVVNIQTQVMDGAYSFFPKFNKNSSVEVFGFDPVSLPGGNIYGTLSDDSMKGRIGCWYKNVGTYKGRQIDIKCTVTDYTFYSFEGEPEVGYFQVDTQKIGLNATNTKDISANMEFFDHETGEPVRVKGFATFADIDIRQGIEILSPVDEVFVTKDCKLYKAQGKNLFTAPWNLYNTVDSDTGFQIQANYDSHNLAYKFYSGCENYCFSDGSSVNGESRQVWKNGYTGNVADYDIVNEKEGCLWQGWQGLYYGRMGRISLSEPLSKTVSDTDEKNVSENILKSREEHFTYKLSHYVPYEMEMFHYTSYTIYDEIHKELTIFPEACKVLLDDGTDVSKWFQISVKGQKVSFSVKPEIASTEKFYDQTYHCYIEVSIASDTDLSKYEGDRYSVKNRGYVIMKRPQGEEKKISNEVQTFLMLPKGEITVTKRIKKEDIIWAHGNPVFLFVVEGKDYSGAYHKYEDYVIFTKDNYKQEANGYISLNTVFEDLPLGEYEVYEKKTLRYYLSVVHADTKNMHIKTVQKPSYGLEPKKVAYGKANLTSEAFQAGITFENEKQRYDGYSHSSVVTNTVSFSPTKETPESSETEMITELTSGK